MFWQITDEDLWSSQQGNPGALQRVYSQALEPCARIAYSLCGDPDQAQQVMRKLVRRSVRQFRQWKYADEASAWFMHQTILLLREIDSSIQTRDDPLLKDVAGPDVIQYAAMIRAIRNLPQQQKEAFLLTHAQRWNTRLCAIAMDCSNTAVVTHLKEAERQLQPLLGQHASALVEYLHQVHRSMPIQYPKAPIRIGARIRARRALGRLVYALGWGLILLIVLTILWFCFVLWPRTEI